MRRRRDERRQTQIIINASDRDKLDMCVLSE